MTGHLWVLGAATVVLAGVMTYAVTRRYGWGAAVAVPVLALAAVIGMAWQDRGLGFSDGMGMAGETLAFVSPVLLGAALGIAAGLWRRG
jgi:hypothetical protein